jgi:hypothetical protein
MKALRLLSCLLAVLLAGLANNLPAAMGDVDGWSQEANGLQARLTLVEKDKLHGARWLVPYLELRNVRDLANRLERMRITTRDGQVHNCPYETGKQSMGTIYAIVTIISLNRFD